MPIVLIVFLVAMKYYDQKQIKERIICFMIGPDTDHDY